MLKFVHYYNNRTSWVQSCDWWAGRQLAVGAKAGYQRQVDGGVVISQERRWRHHQARSWYIVGGGVDVDKQAS